MARFSSDMTGSPASGRFGLQTKPVCCCLALLIGLAGMKPALADPAPEPAGGQPAVPVSLLNRELAKLAAEIKKIMDQRGEAAVAVGDFTGAARLKTSAGPVIVKALREELAKLKVELSARAKLEVSGEYRTVEDDETRRTVVKILAHITDAGSGAKVLDLVPSKIFDLATFFVITGVTVDTTPSNPAAKPAVKEQEREEKIKAAIDNPQPHVTADKSKPHLEAVTIVSAGPKSPYSIEALVAAEKGYLPRKVEVDPDGFSFVKIHQGEKYAVRLINDSDLDAAVTLTIDGLNVFAFSENSEYTHWIVPAHTSLVVNGWHRSNTLANKFEIVGFADCPAAKELKSAASIGTITAAFAAAWPEGSPVPADEDVAKGAEDPSEGASGTALGGEVKVEYREVRRHVGRPRAAVSVRYDKTIEPRDLPTVAAR